MVGKIFALYVISHLKEQINISHISLLGRTQLA